MSLQSDHDDDYASAADDSALSSEEEEDGDSMAEDDIYDGSIEGDKDDLTDADVREAGDGQEEAKACHVTFEFGGLLF